MVMPRSCRMPLLWRIVWMVYSLFRLSLYLLDPTHTSPNQKPESPTVSLDDQSPFAVCFDHSTCWIGRHFLTFLCRIRCRGAWPGCGGAHRAWCWIGTVGDYPEMLRTSSRDEDPTPRGPVPPWAVALAEATSGLPRRGGWGVLWKWKDQAFFCFCEVDSRQAGVWVPEIGSFCTRCWPSATKS